MQPSELPSPIPSPGVDRSALAIVLAIAGLVIVGGLFQFRHYLLTSERALEDSYQSALANTSLVGLQNSNAAAQLQADQGRDDDQDGLNNFQESSIYSTSPYLADTDSDGISDPDELTAGTDPNCALNANCATALPTPNSGANSQVVENIAPDFATSDVSREQMIEALTAAGISETTLSTASDEALRTLYQQLQVATENGSNPVAQLKDQADAVLNMSLAEKRQLLKESGIAAETVDGLSDDEVDQLVTTAVEDILKEQNLTPDTEPEDVNQTANQ